MIDAFVLHCLLVTSVLTSSRFHKSINRLARLTLEKIQSISQTVKFKTLTMTSFANAFSSSEDSNSQPFSNVDLDQQTINQEHSSYVSLTDAATFQTDPIGRISPLTSSPQELPPTNPNDRRISMPDMTKISASSAAAVAAVAPTIDKLKQWSRSAYKCTKQTIYEKLGKTTRTVDVELENQIEVR